MVGGGGGGGTLGGEESGALERTEVQDTAEPEEDAVELGGRRTIVLTVTRLA